MANTEWAFPFADSNGDRMYSDADFAKFFSAWFVNGVFINVGGGLQLVDSIAGGMRITLKSGAANINGRVYYLNGDTEFTVPVASSTKDRTDSVVLRLDLSNRTMSTIYKQSDTSLVRNDSTYEIQLAKISVNKNISEITQSMITDMRTNKSVCGLASPNNPIDVDTFIAQFKSQFNEQLDNNNNDFINWFTNLQNQLNSNQASNLQNQINTINTTLPTLAKDSNAVHNTGNEDINGNKNFKDNTKLNTVTTTLISDQTINLAGINIRFYETTLGVNVLYSGRFTQNADGYWHSFGNMPSNITRPVMDNVSNSVQWSGIGGVTYRIGISLLIKFSPDGSILYKMISLKENDNKTYKVSIEVDGSSFWIK